MAGFSSGSVGPAGPQGPAGADGAPGPTGPAGSGGGDYPVRVLACAAVEEDQTSLLASTPTTTGTASHVLTMPAGPARSISITLSPHAVFVGPWTATGPGPDGVERTVNIAIPSGGSTTVYTDATFGPGTITLSRPAQGGTSGSYSGGVGPRIGLPHKALETNRAGYPVHVVAMHPAATFAAIDDGETFAAVGPSDEGVNGALVFAPGTLALFNGEQIAVSYVGDET